MAVLNDGCCVGCRKEPRAEDAKLTCANCGNVAHVECAEWTCNASCNAAFLASEYNKIKERVEAARRDAAVSSDEEDNDESEDEAESVAEKKQKEKLEALRAKLVQNSVSHQTLREENTRLVVLAEQSTKAGSGAGGDRRRGHGGDGGGRYTSLSTHLKARTPRSPQMRPWTSPADRSLEEVWLCV